VKVIKVKRLIYSKIGSGEIIYGGIEYNGNLSDKTILNSVHELGKTEWHPMAWTYSNDKREQELWLIKFNPKHPDITYPIYRIFVDTFYKYEKTWWDTFCDNIKRILRI